MKPIEQTHLVPPLGNCLAACVASIMELPLSSIPALAGDGWFDTMQAFLRPLNLQALMVGFNDEMLANPPEYMRGYGILAAQSPRGDWLHAVVTCDGVIVHDPHPDRHMGVGKWRDYTAFILIDPAKPSGVQAFRESTREV